MYDRDFFKHNNSDGEGEWDRYKGVSGAPTCIGYGENIIQWPFDVSDSSQPNEDVAQKLVDEWMASSGHYDNIVHPNWTHQGIGVYVVDNGSHVVVWATQNFCMR